MSGEQLPEWHSGYRVVGRCKCGDLLTAELGASVNNPRPNQLMHIGNYRRTCSPRFAELVERRSTSTPNPVQATATLSNGMIVNLTDEMSERALAVDIWGACFDNQTMPNGGIDFDAVARDLLSKYEITRKEKK